MSKATNHRRRHVWSRTFAQVAWFMAGTLVGILLWTSLVAPISIGVAIIPV